MRIDPPKMAQRLLLRFLRDDLAEEVLGDLDEKFYAVSRHDSARKAKLNYWIQVINYLRPFAIRKSRLIYSNQYDMLQNYFKIGWRSLSKQKMYSLIKIGGFALGIAACVMISLFIQDELSYDKHHPDAGRIYRVIGVYNDKGDVEKGVHFQPPMAQALTEDYIEIEKAGRYNNVELFGAANAEMRRPDQLENIYEESITFMDQNLFEMFRFPMVHGSVSHALAQPNTIVLTRSKAEKYFPNENPVGKTLIINNNLERPYTVGGVVENFPTTSHLRFDFILTLTEKEFWAGEQTDWCCSNYPTYVLLKPGVDVKALEKKMTKGVIDKYVLPRLIKEGRVDAEEIVKKGSLELQPVTSIHLYSDGISDGLSHSNIRFVWMFGAIAVIVLLIASINFINLSTAKSANRAKEVGLRKVVGSYRTNLISQFLTESILYSVLSFVLGLTLAWLLLPYFNLLAAKSLSFPWSWWLIPGIIIASITVGLLAGIYPAFYLSAFKPVQILKGNISRGSKSSGMRGSLVVVQFTVSIVLIVGTFIIYRQTQFMLNTKLGFNKDHVMVIQGANTLGDKAEIFRNELLELPQVKAVSVSDYLPVRGTKRNGNQFFIDGRSEIDKPVSGQFWRIDHGYIETMGMKIVEGRNFDPEKSSDAEAVIINQKMANALGLTDPVGKRIINPKGHDIIGVVEDFHFESLKENIEPLVMGLGTTSSLVAVKIDGSDISDATLAVTGVWKKIVPHQPIRYTFLDESYKQMYKDVKHMGLIFTSCSVFAIMVACLGLFGLSAFMTEQRSKEISIRLVLGASLTNVLRLLTQDFLKLVGISFVIAAPLSWYLMKKWLDDYAYKIEITWDAFAIAGVIALVIALATISYQSLRAALVNPVNNLRSE